MVSIKYKSRNKLISGFLIDFNERWTLIKSNPVDYVIDGYILLKTDQIISYVHHQNEEFCEAVILAKGELSLVNPGIKLTTYDEILASLSHKYGAFSIELNKEDSCNIGRLKKVLKHKILIQEIDLRCNWYEEYDEYSMESIRLVEFDTDYINSLIAYNRKVLNTSV